MTRDGVIKGVVCLAVAATCLVVSVRRYPMVGETLAGGEMRAVNYHHAKLLEERESFASMVSRWYTALRNGFTKKPADNTTDTDTTPDTTPTLPTLPLPTTPPPTTTLTLPNTLPPLPPLALQTSQPAAAVASRYAPPTSPAALADGAWLPPAL